jgi:hypothetical protein
MDSKEDLYFSDGSVELPSLDIGYNVEMIPGMYPELGEGEVAVRLDYQPGGKMIDGRGLDQLEEAVGELERNVEGSYTLWDPDSFEDGTIRYLETLKACMRDYPENFESDEMLFDPVLTNRESVMQDMGAVVEAVDETGLDSGYSSFKGFSVGGFDTAFIEDGEELRDQNPRFVAKIQSPAGTINVGHLSGLAYDGSGQEFGVRARLDHDEDRVAGRMMGLGLDPENRDVIDLEEDTRELVEELERIGGFNLVESEIPIYEDDPLLDTS